MSESSNNKEGLLEKVAGLPTGCGVYQFLDKNERPLYIGKAKNIRGRVRSYFRKDKHLYGRLRIMIAKAVDVQVILTDNEAEALILENNLIKERRPRYNINLSGTTRLIPTSALKNEPFPRIFPTRRVVKDGSKYFGPYTDVSNMKRALGAIRSIFKIRTCSLDLSPEPISRGKYQVCLEFHIQKCAGPCIGNQSSESYEATISQIETLLKGHYGGTKESTCGAMQRASSLQQYEEAARLRNQISAVEKYAQSQKVVTTKLIDRDLFALATAREENAAVAVCFKVREGKIIGREHRLFVRLRDMMIPF